MARKPKKKAAAKTPAKKKPPIQSTGIASLLRIREYARHAGVTAPTIVRAIREGKIKPARHDKIGPLIDPVEADRTWKNAPRIRRQAMKMISVPDESIDGEGGDRDQAGESEATTPEAIPKFFRSKTIKEHFAAKKAELDYRKAAGEVVESVVVQRQAYKLARKARDRLQSIPDRLAPILAAETNVDKIHRMIADEIADICREIAADVEIEAEPIEVEDSEIEEAAA